MNIEVAVASPADMTARNRSPENGRTKGTAADAEVDVGTAERDMKETKGAKIGSTARTGSSTEIRSTNGKTKSTRSRNESTM